MPDPIDLRLQLVLERHSDFGTLIRESVRGGVTCVQWRDKFLSDRDFYLKAMEIKEICRQVGVPLIINDRVDVAIAVGADAVHLGQTDLPVEIVRQLLPSSIQIGLSAESFDDIERAEGYEIDYLAISPVFETPTKIDVHMPFGLEGLARARLMSRHRLVAIGGVKPKNAMSVLEAGADGLAVVTAITRSKNPYEASRAFVV